MNAAPLASHELWLDTRLGNAPQWVIAPKSEAMQIHPTIEKCVVFLASKTADGMRLRGTAFLLVHPLGYPHDESIPCRLAYLCRTYS